MHITKSNTSLIYIMNIMNVFDLNSKHLPFGFYVNTQSYYCLLFLLVPNIQHCTFIARLWNIKCLKQSIIMQHLNAFSKRLLLLSRYQHTYFVWNLWLAYEYRINHNEINGNIITVLACILMFIFRRRISVQWSSISAMQKMYNSCCQCIWINLRAPEWYGNFI